PLREENLLWGGSVNFEASVAQLSLQIGEVRKGHFRGEGTGEGSGTVADDPEPVKLRGLAYLTKRRAFVQGTGCYTRPVPQRRNLGGARREASERVILTIPGTRGHSEIPAWTLNVSRGGLR